MKWLRRRILRKPPAICFLAVPTDQLTTWPRCSIPMHFLGAKLARAPTNHLHAIPQLFWIRRIHGQSRPEIGRAMMIGGDNIWAQRALKRASCLHVLKVACKHI